MSGISIINGAFNVASNPFPIIAQSLESAARKTGEKTHEVFIAFRDVAWPFIKNSYLLAQQALKIAATHIPEFAPKILSVIASIGLAQIVHALLILSKYPLQITQFIKDLKLGDFEGVLLDGIGLIVSPVEAFKSVMTFVSSLADLGVIPVVEFFGLIALPISLALLSYATLKGGYDVVRLGIHKHQLPSRVNNFEDTQKLKDMLIKKIGITEAELKKIRKECFGEKEKIDQKIKDLKARKIHIINRQTDKKITSVWVKTLQYVEENNLDLDKINEGLSISHSLMNRKITVGVAGTIAHGALLTTLAAATVFPVAAPIATPIVVIVRLIILLARHAYMQFLFTHGLDMKDWLEPPKGLDSNTAPKVE